MAIYLNNRTQKSKSLILALAAAGWSVTLPSVARSSRTTANPPSLAIAKSVTAPLSGKARSADPFSSVEPRDLRLASATANKDRLLWISIRN